MAVHLSRAGHRGGEPDGDSRRTADQPPHHLRHGDEFLLRAALWPARSTPWPACRRALQMLANAPGKFVGRNTQYSTAAASADQFFEVLATSPADFDAWVAKGQARRRASSMPPPTPSSPRRAPAGADHLLFGVRAQALRFRSSPSTPTPTRRRAPARHRPRRAEIERMFGKLTIEALPLYSAIAATGALVTVGGAFVVVRRRHLAQGVEVSVDRVADQRRPQAHRRHVHRAGADHAAARLRRRHHDARPAGDRAEQRRATCRPSTTTRSSAAHGTIMIFFVAMPFVTGLMNIVVPLQIGARDVAFPFLNSRQLLADRRPAPRWSWSSLVIGEFARTGWTGYPPLFRASSTARASASTTGSGRCRSAASARR